MMLVERLVNIQIYLNRDRKSKGNEHELGTYWDRLYITPLNSHNKPMLFLFV